MTRTFISQPNQIFASELFDDTRSVGSPMTGSVTLEEDLNNIRTQLRQILWAGISGSWYDSTTKGLNTINSDFTDFEQKRLIYRCTNLNTVIIHSSSIFAELSTSLGTSPSQPIALGTSVQTGSIVAELSTDVGAWSLEYISGSTSARPKNLVVIRDAWTGQPIQDSLNNNKDVYALIQIENGASDGGSFNDSNHQSQLSFVVESPSGTLGPASVSAIGGKHIIYSYPCRTTLDSVPEDAFLSDIIFIDAIATNGNVIDDNIVATVSGTTFTGVTNHNAGLSGSLTQLTDGRSFIAAGDRVTITSSSNGQIIISADSQSGVGADSQASYVVIGITGSLPNERALTAGTGLLLTDAGANGNVTLGINDNVIATVSGSIFTGVTKHNVGLSGSLTRLTDDSSYLVAGTNITITSASNGQVIVAAATQAGVGADSQASFIVLGVTSSLDNERALSAGTGLILIDGGAGSTATFDIDDNIVATVSGATFTGNVVVGAGLSGSLQNLSDGSSYLVAGTNITITSGTNGQVTVSSADDPGADPGASYVVVGLTASLGNERALSAGIGLTLTDGGADAAITFDVDDNVVATISGSTFTGPVVAGSGLSGSLQNLSDGSSYLISGGSITIVSQSNGQILISSSVAGTLAIDTPITSIKSAPGLIGTSSFAARSDHRHDISTNVASAASIGQSSTEGSSTSLARSDHSHQHSSSNPVDIGEGNLEGVATTFVRSDHVHAHGNLSGSTLHAVASTSTSGFLSATDKTKLDNLSGSSADVDASYVVIGLTSSLPNERVLAGGTGMLLTDAGANANVTLGIDNNIVATVSGTTFTGVTKHNVGLSGSLTQLTDGSSYLIAGTNISVVTQSNGSVLVSTQLNQGADLEASYIVVALTASLPNERALTAGSGLLLIDAGANGNITFGINDNVVATVSGTTFTGNVVAQSGLSGSLQNLANGSSYLVAGSNVTIISQSNGQVIITAADDIGADPFASYVVIGTTGSLSNERALIAGTGLTLVDGGANGNATFTINDNIVATISGTTFIGPVSASAGLSGSLQQITSGLSYLVAAGDVTIISQSNGQVIISASSGGLLTSTPPLNVTKSTALIGTSSFVARSDHKHDVSTAVATGATAGQSNTEGVVTTLARSDHTHEHLVGTPVDIGEGNLSGVATTFIRSDHIHAHGNLSGSSLHVVATTSAAGFMSAADKSKIDLLSGSNADVFASYVVIGLTSSLPNERALTAGTGLLLTDAGAGATTTFSINDGIIATISGSTFTGATKHNAGLSGSLTQLTDASSYLIAGGGINITSQSNGSIVISSSITPSSILQTKVSSSYPDQFGGTPITSSVTFGTPFNDDAYSVILTSVTENNTTFSPVIQTQLSTGFTINMGTNDITDLLKVNWIAIRHGEST